MPLDALQLMQGYRARDLANQAAQQRMNIVPQELAMRQQVAEQAQQRQKALADMQGQQMMQKVQQGRQLAAYQAASLASRDMDRASTATSRGLDRASTLKSRDMDRASRERIETERAKAAAAKTTHDINLAGGRESTFINRVISAGNQASRDLENVVKLPMTASIGFFGGRGQAHGILNAGKETLANKMTTKEVQDYKVLATGFQRALAAIENSGLAVPGSLSTQMEAVLFRDGDFNSTKLRKLAQTRQIVEAGLETVFENPRVPEQTKKHIQDILDRVRKSVPFTQDDLYEMERQQEINPNSTLEDVLKARKSSGGATKEGAEQMSKSGKPMIYRNGQWEYK